MIEDNIEHIEEMVKDFVFDEDDRDKLMWRLIEFLDEVYE